VSRPGLIGPMSRRDEAAPPFWSPDHPVIEVLRRRRADGYRPGRDDDGHRIGLAIEGGGMRGIVSAAMVTALEELGFRSVFDAVYAASSGAMNAVYFLAGSTWYTLSIYYDDLAGPHFIDFRRALCGRPVLNLEFALRDVVDTRKPLDVDAVLRSPTELHIAITLVDRMRTLDAHEFADKADLVAALRASTWLPIAMPGTTRWHGERALDGGVLTAHPVTLARDDDCTHILSLSTRPMGRMTSPRSPSQRMIRSQLERIRHGLGDGYIAGLERNVGERADLLRRRTDPAAPPYVLDLAPLPGMTEIKRHDVDPGRLINAARQAYAVAYCALEREDVAAIGSRSVRIIPRFTVVRDGDVSHLPDPLAAH